VLHSITARFCLRSYYSAIWLPFSNLHTWSRDTNWMITATHSALAKIYNVVGRQRNLGLRQSRPRVNSLAGADWPLLYIYIYLIHLCFHFIFSHFISFYIVLLDIWSEIDIKNAFSNFWLCHWRDSRADTCKTVGQRFLKTRNTVDKTIKILKQQNSSGLCERTC
jgi:hypothetical protein